MPDSKEEQKLRGYVAYLAAKIIMDNMEISFMDAKKKAAKQAKVTPGYILPSDEEIETQLQSQSEVFNGENTTTLTRNLRLKSLNFMRELSEFNIYLVGPLVQGIRPKISAIDFHCYTDDVNNLEFFFINNEMHYRIADKQVWMGHKMHRIPVYLLEYISSPVTISVLPEKTSRQKIKGSFKGKAFEKMNMDKLEKLLS